MRLKIERGVFHYDFRRSLLYRMQQDPPKPSYTGTIVDFMDNFSHAHDEAVRLGKVIRLGNGVSAVTSDRADNFFARGYLPGTDGARRLPAGHVCYYYRELRTKKGLTMRVFDFDASVGPIVPQAAPEAAA